MTNSPARGSLLAPSGEGLDAHSCLGSDSHHTEDTAKQVSFGAGNAVAESPTYVAALNFCSTAPDAHLEGPPLDFSIVQVAVAEAPLVRELQFTCGNPAIERVCGTIQYLVSTPRTLSAWRARAEGIPTISTDSGTDAVCKGNPLIPHPHSGVGGGGGPSDSCVSGGSPTGCRSLLTSEQQSSGTSEGSVLLVAPRVPSHISPAAFCEFVEPHVSDFRQARVLQGATTSDYIILIECGAPSAREAIGALNGLFYGAGSDAFCELRIVKDITVTVRTAGGPGNPQAGGPSTVDPKSDDCIANFGAPGRAPGEGGCLLLKGNGEGNNVNNPGNGSTGHQNLDTSDLNGALSETIVRQDAAEMHTKGLQSRVSVGGASKLLTRFDAQKFCPVCLERLGPPGPRQKSPIGFQGMPTVGTAITTHAAGTEDLHGDPTNQDTEIERTSHTIGLSVPSDQCNECHSPIVPTNQPTHLGNSSALPCPAPCTSEAPLESGFCNTGGGGLPVSVLCGHCFHASCLGNWRDPSCPVCRYQQHPLQPCCCSVCGATEGLLVCLVCGLTGCGDQRVHQEKREMHGANQQQKNTHIGPEILTKGHARLHYEQTSHAHALESQSNRVWDFESGEFLDAIVSKLCREKAGRDASISPKCDCSTSKQPLDSVEVQTKGGWVLEFNQLLAASLESQEDYYKKRIKEIVRMYAGPLADCREALSATEEAARSTEEELSKLKKHVDLLQKQYTALEQEHLKQQQRLPVLQGLHKSLCEKIALQRQEEEAKQKQEKGLIAEKFQRIEALKQEIRDLRFHIEASRQLGQSADTQNSILLISTREERQRRRRGR